MDMISQLPFDLIKPRSFTIKRRGVGELIDGIWTQDPPSDVVIQAVVSPCIKKSIIDILPEALRKRKVIRIFSNTELKEHIDAASFDADEITYNNQTYRVFHLGDWVDVNGYTAYEAFAVRIDTNEIEVLP